MAQTVFNYQMADSFYLCTTNRIVFDVTTENINLNTATPIVRFRSTFNGSIVRELTVANGGLTILSTYTFKINPYKQTLAVGEYIGGVRFIFSDQTEKEYITFKHNVLPTAAYKK